jgi:hypothetical protein
MGRNTRRKRLKIKVLGVFQNGAILPSFEIGSALAEKGRDWANRRNCKRTFREVLGLQLGHLSTYKFEKRARAERFVGLE